VLDTWGMSESQDPKPAYPDVQNTGDPDVQVDQTPEPDDEF
jgi:hypothetical protein